MSSIDPQLVALGEEYDRLVAAVTAGHVDGGAAMGALAGLHVTDGSGAIWQIDMAGKYTRADFMGAPALEADPSLFAATGTGPVAPPAIPFPGAAAPTYPGAAANAGAPLPPAHPTHQAPATPATPQPPMSHPAPSPMPGPMPGPSPMPAGAPGVGGFATGPAVAWSDASAPGSAAAGRVGAGGPASPASPGSGGPAASGPFGSVSAANPFPDAPMHPVAAAEVPTETAGKGRKKAPTKSLQKADRDARLPGLIASLRARVAGHGVLFVLVIAGLALFGILQMQGKSSTSTTLPAPSAQAPTSEPATQDEQTLPADTGGASALPLASIPSRADATAMVSTLSSGRRELVAAAAAGKPAAATVSLAAAEWAGVRQLGITVSPGAALVDGQVAVQRWVLTQGETTVAELKVRWVLRAGQWKLESLPLLPAS